MNYTDEQLKRTLAKMLPEKVGYHFHALLWIDSPAPEMPDVWDVVLDTELLQLCFDVWMTLTRLQRGEYSTNLFYVVRHSGGHAASTNEDILHCCENATWQQRTIALAKTLNIEIV